MEILSESTEWASFIFLTALISIMALLAWYVVGLFITYKYKEVIDYAFGAVFTFVAVIATLGVIAIIDAGPDTYYKATITDFNEVYEQGYEIVEQDGKIFTLRESEAE